jgi:hypothetical protein
LNERDEERRPATEPRSHDAGSEPAAFLEPLERRSDRAAVDECRAHAGRAIRRVEHRQRRGVAHASPSHAAQQAGRGDEPARAETIDQPAIERLHPRLEKNEHRECCLDIRQRPAGLLLHGTDKERPCILQVGDHDHRDDRRDELEPAIVDAHDATPSTFASTRCPRCSSRSLAQA